MGEELSWVAQMTGGELSRVEKDGIGTVWGCSNDRRGIVRVEKDGRGIVWGCSNERRGMIQGGKIWERNCLGLLK